MEDPRAERIVEIVAEGFEETTGGMGEVKKKGKRRAGRGKKTD